MKCPVDGEVLVIAERNGVEIDYCPECRGVWLDRGELDKIIDRSAAPRAPERPAPGSYHGGISDAGYRRKKKKRSSLLEEFFDF